MGRLYNHPEADDFHELLSDLTLQLESQGKEGYMEKEKPMPNEITRILGKDVHGRRKVAGGFGMMAPLM